MKCAWKELLSVLPPRLRQEVDQYEKENLQEIRMRLDRPVELVQGTASRWLDHRITASDLSFVVNTASRYSPWAAASMQYGYITISGGHRIGLCGECVVHNGVMTGIRDVTSLCVRVARDIRGIAPKIQKEHGSVLILGPPGSGKTTLLRDLIRQIGEWEPVVAVDERGEIFPFGSGFSLGSRVDIMTNCPKSQGVISVLRSMGPKWIAVDEITDKDDCLALIEAGWCGVRLLATAHASDKSDLMTRPVYIPLAHSGIFRTLLILQQDKSWRMERI